MATRAIILDLDGTLWNSYPLFAKALEDVAGIPVADTLAQLQAEHSIVQLFGSAGISRAKYVRAVVDRATSTILYEGMDDALKKLQRRGTHLGIFTSLPGSIAMPILEVLDLDSKFTGIAHRGNSPAKPSPTGILEVLDTMKVMPSTEVFYVGDLERDSETAKRAGIAFGWASYGYGTRQPSYVSRVIQNPKEILTL